MIEPKFKKGDHIINRSAHDMAVYDKTDNKGYMHFKYFYSGMFHKFNDVRKYTLQVNYQKFWDLCTEEEIEKLDELIKTEKEKGDNIAVDTNK